MSKRIKDMKTPAMRLREKVFSVLAVPFNVLSERQQFWIGFAVLCIATTFLIHNPVWRAPTEQQYRAGDIARESIIVPADIAFTDTDDSARRKLEARNSVKPIFRYESNKAEQAVQRFLSSWEKLLRRDNETPAMKPSNSDAKIENRWTGAGGLETGKTLASRTFSKNELDAVQSALRESAEGYIYDDSDKQYFQNQVAVLDRSRPNLQTTVSMPESSWTPLSTARQKLKQRLEGIKSLSPKEIDAFHTAAEILVEPSVTYDSVATEAARERAADEVEPTTIVLKRGQKLVNEGDIITDSTLANINALRNYGTSSRQLNRFAGILIFVTGLFWLAWQFVQNRGTLPRLALSSRKTFALLGLIVVIQTALLAVFFRMAEFTALQNLKAPLNDPMLWSFAVPFAMASLLMTLLADRPTALITGIFASFVAGLMAPKGFEFAIFSALVSAVAVYGIGRYRSRQTVTMAGGLVGAAGALLAIALIAFTQQPIVLNTILLAIACGLFGGLMTSALTAVLLPLCENFFGILTDVKLLELSNADLPVLGQLALRAPGTNQHSHAVGQLAEEACRVVNANGLLARIGALYHDIGKTAAPEHYVENQTGNNPHDRLKALQSAKIIISHVTYGMKLAKEMRLPQRIIDFIPQHHGTRTLHYFLKKAQEESRTEEDVSENDFRYPGPKPQFKEAAIMMIADSCEAAARSLAEPNPENIRFIVTKIIDAIIVDDQLGECDLTLRELTQIRESMIKSLIAIYHSRVDYPGYVPPTSGQFRFTSADDPGDDNHKYTDPDDIPVSPGGEIEDEAIDHGSERERAEAKAAD